MSEIILKNVRKDYDNKSTVIENLNLTIASGSFTVLVGPSGCGKSTTLRMIAGLEDISSGELYIDGKKMNDIDPGDRDIAMVFQNYALYPTMTVKGNIEFGLINAKIPKEEREQLIEEIIDIVGLREYLDKKPSQLSGGQRQRVALARAMVKKPKVFLMDEPLSNLDAKLRNQMRSELIELHHKLNATFVYVTHDQVEALSMATDIVLMEKGKIRQHGSPHDIYTYPKNVFTAQFIGTPEMNIIERQKFEAIATLPEQIAYIGFRPSKVKMYEPTQDQKQKLVFTGTVLTKEMLGSEIIYRVQTNMGVVAVKMFSDINLNLDDEIKLSLSYSSIHCFDENKNRMDILRS
ncbi:ABC transporter ATP-binding protein [Beduini massiliensis]|uniref:ABC transporter ATP-binding protein n=1 Tax=Beduini massiliensis TaxID=1585974 RepID=UPI00059A8D11|nr:ABC transporter ATP-binding protein [Beduini massiliensis]